MKVAHTHTARDGLEEALAVTASVSRLAEMIGVRQPAVSKWRRKGYVPVDRVPQVERATGVPRWRLRPDKPDLFPPPEAAAASGC